MADKPCASARYEDRGSGVYFAGLCHICGTTTTRTAPDGRAEHEPLGEDVELTQCIYCGQPAYETGWGCHACGMDSPADEKREIT